MRRVTCKAGDVLASAGSSASTMYIVLSGSLTITAWPPQAVDDPSLLSGEQLWTIACEACDASGGVMERGGVKVLRRDALVSGLRDSARASEYLAGREACAVCMPPPLAEYPHQTYVEATSANRAETCAACDSE